MSTPAPSQPPEGKPKMIKITITVAPEDLLLLKAAGTYFYGVAASVLIRAALREGLPAVVKDRSKLAAEPVLLPPASSKRGEAIVIPSPAAAKLTPTSEALLQDMESEPEANEERKARGRARKAKG